MGPASMPQRVEGTGFAWHELVRRVTTAATAADGREPLNEEALLALANHGLDGASLFVVEDGFALVRDTHLDLVVDPGSRGAGLGTALLETATADQDRELRAWSHGNHRAAARLATTHGFRRTRELWLMRRPASPVARLDSEVPIRAFVPGQDERAFLAVNAAAFAHHPEQGSLSIEGLKERMAEAWFDPAGFFLAVRGEEVLGFHWTKVHPDGTGEVYVIGVSPDAQGLGLGRALVSRGVAHLQPREVILYVEGDNPSAIELYESLGFSHADSDTDVQYTRVQHTRG